MIDGNARQRIEREYEYQTTRLRNLFKTIYRDENEAWGTWQTLHAKKGFDFVLKRFREKPKAFGKLRGTLWLGFMKDQAFRDREFAVVEATKIASYWKASDLQRQSSTDVEEEIKRPDWKARSRDTQRDDERER